MLLGIDIQTHSDKIQTAATLEVAVQQSLTKHRPNTTHKLLSFWLALQHGWGLTLAFQLPQTGKPPWLSSHSWPPRQGDFPATWSGVLATHPSTPNAPRDPLQSQPHPDQVRQRPFYLRDYVTDFWCFRLGHSLSCGRTICKTKQVNRAYTYPDLPGLPVRLDTFRLNDVLLLLL